MNIYMVIKKMKIYMIIKKNENIYDYKYHNNSLCTVAILAEVHLCDETQYLIYTFFIYRTKISTICPLIQLPRYIITIA